jgi:la-related protein 1
MSTFWVKDKDAPIEVLPTDLVHESYSVFRKRAIQQRASNSSDSYHRDMDVLYQFWSHFLIRNFNARMYNEFKSLAFDDVSSKGSTRGLDYLIHFYDAALSSNRTISDEVALDLITVIRTESQGDGQRIFESLRSVWKSNVFDINARTKIDRVLDEDLRTELEK